MVPTTPIRVGAGAVLVLAIVIAACARVGAPADASLRPEGQGWHCWEQQGGPEKDCRRTASDCESNRERRLRFRGGLTLSNCAPGPETAYCFTFIEKEFDRRDYRCAPDADTCSRVATDLEEDPTTRLTVTAVSGCEVWR